MCVRDPGLFSVYLDFVVSQLPFWQASVDIQYKTDRDPKQALKPTSKTLMGILMDADDIALMFEAGASLKVKLQSRLLDICFYGWSLNVSTA